MKERVLRSKLLLSMLSVLVLFSGIFLTMSFVSGAHVITTSTGGTSFSVDGTDISHSYNITVNNTDILDTANITQVNITIPNTFIFESDTNGTNAGYLTFTNTTNVLSWENNSGLVMNLTSKYFWFNATASTPGIYDLIVTTLNATGAYSTNISVIVNAFVSECEINLNTSGITYTLEQSINAWNSDCLGIGAENIILDCNGYNITYGGDDNEYNAIGNPEGYDNITIKNCIISQNGTAPKQHAISFEGSENAVIFNNTIITLGGLSQLENGSFGIRLDGNSTNANITFNTINTNATYGIGILLSNSGNATINNNIIITYGDYAKGINIDASASNNLTSNTVTTYGENAAGIHMESGDDIYSIFSLIYNNTITTSGNNNSQGIFLSDYSGNMNITSNTITTSGSNSWGIKVFSVNNSLISNIITTSGNESRGIHLSSSNLSTANSNTITTTGPKADGIYIESSTGNNLTNNIINTTKGLAIWVAGLVVQDYNHTIENNTEQGDMIYYLFNNDSGIIENINAGQIIAASSNNLTLDGLTLNKDGISFFFTDNSTIKNSNITLSEVGVSQNGSRDIYWGMGFSSCYYTNITNNTITTSGTAVDGIYMEEMNHSTFTNNKIHVEGLEAFVIYLGLATGNNTFYNNFFNSSIINSLSQSGFGYAENDAPTDFYWNTTKTSGTNIVGKSYIGGNYWGNNNGTGYSDTCIDANGDYICDVVYNFGGTDYLPLATYTTQVDECREITLANTLHRLNQSISATGVCFNITGNNITLDFNGYNITGNTTGSGVNVVGYNGTTILDGFIYNFSTGIYFRNNADNNITNMTSSNNNLHGIAFSTSLSNSLSAIKVSDNGGKGIIIETSSNNVFTDITSHSNSHSGIYLVISPSNTFTDISINYSGIRLDESSSNTFTDINISDSRNDAILLQYATSDNNNFTNAVIINTNSSYYDINFSTAGIDGTWIIDSSFANYTFTGAGSLVNFKNSSSGVISFLEPINGSGTNLSNDIIISSNLVFVSSANNAGLNKSANITLYGITYTDPKPQYSFNGTTFTDCTISSNPACSEISGFSGNTFIFNVSHFTYFRSAEAYSAPATIPPSTGGSGGGGSSSGLLSISQLFPFVSPDNPAIMKISNENLRFTEIKVQVFDNLTGVKLVLTKMEALPSDIEQPEGETYIYLQLNKTNILDNNVNKVTIKFKVAKSWLAEKEYGNNDVLLYRHNGKEWSSLTTSMLSEDADYAYYQSLSPGLSIFAISAKSTTAKSAIKEGENVTEVEIPSEPTDKAVEEAEKAVKKSKLWKIVGFAAAIIIILLVTIYLAVRRKKK
ncbi:MAG: PGF-pre-PGF domain-containing protein [Nanoarchaeota archaeon]|nr:PGF-pre-PGF domain-containing protein [Nanoarchaeota archaeon]